jgi:hypothetical protein
MIAVGITLVSPVASAGSLEKLLMPGALTAAHAELEANCGQCHDRTNKARQRELCADCHEDVRSDLAANAGLHGRIGRGQCSACHSEHLGRDADIVPFAAEVFDHAQTDFALLGAHAAVECSACHDAGRKFREAPHTCGDCHRADDVHRGELGSDCASCHETTRFSSTRFDHARTRFALSDGHARVPCASCHRDSAFKGAPLDCGQCHAADDVHRGSRGTDCASCHDAVDWKRSRFNHARATAFPLEGRHAELPCATCHLGGDVHAALPKDCLGCHAAADRHAGRFGTACTDCHGQQAWPIASYPHERHGQYVLAGAHARLDCHDCHTGTAGQQVLVAECAGCHLADDAHAGSMGRDCASCHAETGWRDSVRFDHDLAAFPLVGLHVSVTCESCHASRAFRGTATECARCHRSDDVHASQLGDACGDCHNPNGWAFWTYDHDVTGFALDGGHRDLACRSCHVEPAHERPLSSECSSCHRRDDVHSGRFGPDCGRCHRTDSFRGAAAR